MNGENIILKRITNTILVLLVFFSTVGIPISAESNVNTTETTSENNNTGETRNLYAEDFSVNATEVINITENDFLIKSNAYTIDGSSIGVNTTELLDLKSGIAGTYNVTLTDGTEELIITVQVKNQVNAINPLVTEINNQLEVSIPAYDDTIGMQTGTVYDVSTKINFDDSNSSNKKLTISLPQGLRYVSYPTNNIVISGIETQATGVLGDFIQNVTTPIKQLGTSYSGNLIYEFVPGTVAVEINIKIQVDELLYLNDGANVGDIVVKGTKGDTVSSVGEVKFENIKTIGLITSKIYSAGDAISKNVLPGEQIVTTKFTFIKSLDGNAATVGSYASKFVFYYYYPKELTYISSSHDSLITEKNLTEGYIKFEYGPGTFPYVTLTLEADGLAEGTYTATRAPYFEIVAHNGDNITVDGESSQAIKIVVKDASSIVNKLGGSIYKPGYYYNYDTSFSSTGPYFKIHNTSAKDMENQWYEVNIDSNYEATIVAIPDISDSSKVYYKTNLDSTLKQADSSTIGIMPGATAHKSISSSALGLADGEYLTYVKAYLGTVQKDYYSHDVNSKDYVTRALGVAGKLKPGISTAPIVVKTYEASSETESPVTGTELVLSSSIIRTDNPITTFYRRIPATTITAGEKRTITTAVLTDRYVYGSETAALVDPVVYIKLLDGVSISNPVATIGGVSTSATLVSEYTTTQGERFASIKIDGIVGAFVDNKIQNLNLNFDLEVGMQVSAQNHDWNSLVFIKDDVNTYGNYWNNAEPVADIYDVDNDGDLTELLMPMGAGNTKLIINSNENLLIDTYIYPEGESRRPAYDGTDEKAVGFTPGTTGVYTVDILNNVDNVAKDIEAYIPVPTVGNNYGTKFQDNAFNWNMKLGATPVLKVEDADGNDITAAKASNYQITYSADATNETNYMTATYNTNYSSDTALIKITNTIGMDRGERAYLTFDYIVDEDTTSIAIAPEKLGSINDFRPYYTFNAGSVAGGLSGTRVGARLDIGVVEGFVFKDTNYNGIYDLGVDTIITGKTIDLYKKDTADVYQYVTSTTTTATGTYTFEDLSNGIYKVDFNDVLDANQLFTIKNVGTNNAVNSNVENIGINSGAIIDIDPTSQDAKQMSAGVIDYESPNIDVTLSTLTIKSINTQQPNITELLTTTITPSYFDEIKVGNIVWSSSDTAVATVDSEGYVKGLSVGTATITAKIKDIYGNEATDIINITVTSNNIPVITGSNMTLEAGSVFDVLTTGVSISDTEDGTIALTDTRVTITDNVPVNGNNEAVTPGTYAVIYEVEDTDGNTASKTINVTIEDTTAPVITTTSTTMTVEANSNSTLPVWETVFGVAVNDIVDGNITADTSKVTYSVSPAYTANNVPGTYTITVSATDAATNNATTTLTYIVEDTTAPSITTTNTPVTVEANSNSALPDWGSVFGVAVTDIVDGDITSDTSKVTYSVSPAYTANNVPGTYTITVSATDAASNNATQTLTYIVEDTTAPEITTTSTSETVEANDNSTLPDWGSVFGVTVTDIVDGDITANTSKVTYNVSPSYTANNVPGTYTITVSATDTASNNATTTLTYIVEDTTAPEITTTSTSVTVEANDNSTLPDWGSVFGVTVTDIVDGDITSNTSKVTYSVSPSYTANNVPGTYTITVSATDAATNNATTTLTYIVEDTTAPTLTIVNTLVYVAKGNTQTEAELINLVGATASDVSGTPIVSIDMASLDFDTVGTYTTTVRAKDATNNEATGSITIEVIELITAENFTVSLGAIGSADFVGLAQAAAWELDTDVTTMTTSVVSLMSAKPTTVGTYPVVFSSAEGEEITVTVLVTNEVAVNNETVVANNFTVALADVSSADFVALANAKGYDVTDITTPIEIPVTEITARPTTVGTHTVRFETANGGYAEVTVLVTNEVPVTNETVVANNFTVALNDVATADFVALANAKGYDVTNVTTPVEIPVTLVSTKPTTVGSHTVRFETANGGYAEVTVLVTNEVPVSNETVVANNFTVALNDVATADFVALANAKGYDVTDPTTPIEIPVTLVSTKPTTVGGHVVRFETANGGYAEVTVLVTNESPVMNEVVVANNFTVALADVSSADFVALANAKGYDVTNVTTPIEIPVTLVSTKPTTVGSHIVRFETANGGYAEVTVLVTNEVPVSNETVVANNFTVALSDVATADFVALANAKGYDVTNPTTPVEIPVTLVSVKPTTVGSHTVRFETANGGYAEVSVEVVTDTSDYELSANHIVMGISALQNAINNSNLNETIISESDAKVVNTITGEAKTDSIDVEVKDLTAPEVKVYNVVLSYEHNNVSAFSTDSETTSTVITKEITLSVVNDNDDTDDQTQSELPKSGQHTKEFYIIGVFLLMLNALIINCIVKKKRKVNR